MVAVILMNLIILDSGELGEFCETGGPGDLCDSGIYSYSVEFCDSGESGNSVESGDYENSGHYEKSGDFDKSGLVI